MPENLDELVQKIYGLIRALLRSTVGVIVIGAILFIIFIITAIVLRV